MAALTRKKSIESLTDLFSRYVIDEEREELDLPFIRDTLRFAARGVGKGFIAYFIPVCILRRRVRMETFRRAMAIAMFAAVARFIDRLLSKKKSELIRERMQKQQEQEGGQMAPPPQPRSSGGTRRRLLINYSVLRAMLGKYRRVIGGILASMAALIIDRDLCSPLSAFWLMVRAIRAMVPPNALPSWTPILSLCLASGQILSCWIAAPDELDPSYLRFLNHQGGQSRGTTAAMTLIIATCEGMERLRALPQGICDIIHPGMGCSSHFLWYFFTGFRRALRIYIPLSIIMFLISKKKSLRDLAVNLTRSTSFLALYCAIAFSSGCLLYRNFPGVSRSKLFLHTFSSGIAAFVERPSYDHLLQRPLLRSSAPYVQRQVELAGYVSTYAIDSLYRIGLKHGLVTPNPLLVRAVFCLSAGVLLYHADQQPAMITRWLLGMDREIRSRPIIVPLLHSMNR